ncbi:conserved protein of unknown function [Acidithiobacillus ferrivorans]|uniref:Uncharacterized protein n=2 Tax=Acidithiobacillus ferrivorans TaxID=160808 RepID=A0A060UUY0_9PROT|nr:hypothetical protein AFERRI_400339 [Acidithiobacillus ferrivorans]SMH64589.1 conserved protein of unknown function [Acidithiobacillus ferrivorans]
MRVVRHALAIHLQSGKNKRKNMIFDRIDRLVTKEGFFFQAWDDRYSKGVWAALGVWENQVDIVRDLSSAGDLDMMPAMDYVFSADWLPYVTGRTLAEAMQKLEERLALLPQDQIRRNSQWAHLVTQAVEALYAAGSGRSWDGNPPKSLDGLPALPATFEFAVEQFDETGRNKGATNAK